MYRGAKEINSRVRDCERRQVLMVAALPARQSGENEIRGQQLRQYLAHAFRGLAARVEPSVKLSRVSASPE
jgi:hypothetical protein